MASYSNFPEDKTQGIYIDLRQRRFTIVQINGPFEHFWSHVTQRANLEQKNYV